jgi:(1->4)-alpha-D-glucan 1-alpha-D-glucosylmutase
VLVFELLALGVVAGLRVDHVDGLADPGEYLERLRRHTDGAYTVVEKILARDEALPGWPVAGTTGYEAGDALTALCIDPDGRARLVAALTRENGSRSFAEVEHESKSFVLDAMFRTEWERVLDLLADDMLVPALREVTLALDVYRTYADTPEDRVRLDRAGADLTPHTAAALRDRLLTGAPSGLATRWRQLSGPVMAKGHEDTACYRYPALLAQNEVGGDPGAGVRDATRRFHGLAAGYGGLIATSTHDSKRSEDVRARLCVLSERGPAFETALRRWHVLVDPAPVVTPTELRFVAQTLLGAWPLHASELPEFATRIGDYLTKALREAKQSSNWITPNEPHERAVIDCALATIAGDGQLFHDAFGPLVDEVEFFGALNSLAMLTWKLGMPGTPDVYRGSELWELTLVDPDNRRPVDFDRRRQALDDIEGTDDTALLTDWRSGAVKLRVTANGLRARREHPDLFRRGEYVPLDAPVGLFAFARRLGDAWAVAVAPRFATRITTCGTWPIGADAWGDAVLTLPDVHRTKIPLAEALATLPCALLVL